jgi:non-canonical purine NTP pyrophosphatase (RdgB/HAM1 family)
MIGVTFITGNQHKADYLAQQLGIPLEHRKLELEEIQSTSLEEIVEHKVKQAYRLIGGPALVEDVALGFDAQGGLPGPFIKFYVEQEDGLEKLCRNVDTLANRRALAACVFGYYDGQRLELLHGELHGTIAEHPRGTSGFGWDAIFCPDGYGGLTRAEMTPTDDAATYATIKPFAALRDLLTNKV